MAEEKKTSKRNLKKGKMAGNSSWGSAYFLAMIGAAVYWVQLADGFGEVLVALLKALVWPAYLVYELLGSIGA